MMNIIGTWKAYGIKEADGNFKKHSAPISLTFEEGGTGKMKILFFKAPIAWELRDGQLITRNVKDGTEIPLHIEEDGTIGMVHENHSEAILIKK